jgi:chemotaxis protein CheC
MGNELYLEGELQSGLQAGNGLPVGSQLPVETGLPEGSGLELIGADEKDVLLEIMNIAFGNAAAELAQVINIFVVLSVPYVQILRARDLPEYIRSEVGDCESVTVVEQDFWGEFKGNAIMVFQSGAGRELAFMLNADDSEIFEPGATDRFESEILMEVGNILIGACVGKLAELLGDVIQYSPPKVLVENHANDALPQNLFDPGSSAIILRTMFRFNDKDIGGFLFLITNHESFAWLKGALADFMAQYDE